MSTPGPYGTGPTSSPGDPPPSPADPTPGAGAGSAPGTGAGPGSGTTASPGSGNGGIVPAPPPPPGPGVQPPFAAPPTDQDRKRLWIGLGAAAAVLLLCTVGGIFGIGALAVGSVSQVRAEARRTVSGYLGDLQGRNYVGAYGYWCASRRQRLSLDEFTSQMQADPPVTGFRLGATELGSQVIQPATVDYAGNPQSVRFLLVQEGSTGGLKICEIAQ